MLIKTRQKPPKDGWYEVEYDPESPAFYEDNRRAFYNGMWRRGRFPNFDKGLNSVFSRCEGDKYNLSSYKPFLEQ